MGISSILGTRSLHLPQVGTCEVNYKVLDMSSVEFGVGKYFSANSSSDNFTDFKFKICNRSFCLVENLHMKDTYHYICAENAKFQIGILRLSTQYAHFHIQVRPEICLYGL